MNSTVPKATSVFPSSAQATVPRFLMLVLSALALFSCQRSESYMHYEVIDASRWDEADRLKFDVPPVTHSGTYAMHLHVRATHTPAFPFKVLYVEMRQQWGAWQRTDTVACPLTDDFERATGIAVRQYEFPATRLYVHQGDSAHITLRHIMRQEEVPGISDIGLSLTPL